MGNKLIIHNAKIVSPKGRTLKCGQDMHAVTNLENGYIIVENDLITHVASGGSYKEYIDDNTKVVDAKGLVMLPGFVDSHTHLVHAGSREHELKLKLEGKTYLEILASGGGILNTVEKTRQATFNELYDKAKNSLDIMLTYGVTTVEAKSGYGLELATELKQLEVAKALNENHPVDIVNTFMGAHAFPLGIERDDYIEEVLKMLNVVKEKDLAHFCDVFCEDGVFSLSESEYILDYAKKLGFKLKIHADEMAPLGGADLACKLGCTSADHLMASTDIDIKKLAEHKIVANLLPATSFNLNKNYARARFMIDSGCGVALSTDYNPGSCPSENLQFVMQLAAIKMKLLPEEIITAVTLNGACSVAKENNIGSIEPGKKADFVLLEIPNLEYLIYHFGINHVKDVYKNGRLVVRDQKLVYEEEK